MEKDKIKKWLKKTRDFILCCRKTIDHVEDMVEMTTKVYIPTTENI